MSHTQPHPVLAPIAEARGLPNAHYTDPALHQRELQMLMARGWAGLDIAAALPEPGDAKPLTFLGQPLLLLRDAKGQVRVFLNVCRHRGMILVDAPRRIEGVIRCPYHSWCYATDGRLITTPHVGGPGQNTHPDIDRATLGLTEIRSHQWLGVVFVNMSGDAPDFQQAMAPALARWAEFTGPFHHASSFTLNVESNWKLAVENYCESYHLPWVHPGLSAISRLEDHYDILSPGVFSGQGTHVFRQMLRDDGQPAFPDFAGLGEKWQAAGEYLSIFPNTLLGVHRDHTFAIILSPDGPTATSEHIHLFYARPDVDPALRDANAALWKSVFEEDISAVEGMQRGRNGQGFDGGRFSPAMDAATHCFHQWVAQQMQA